MVATMEGRALATSKKRGQASGSGGRTDDGLIAVADIIDTEGAAQILGWKSGWTSQQARYGELPVLKVVGTEKHPRYLYDRRAIEEIARRKRAAKAGGDK